MHERAHDTYNATTLCQFIKDFDGKLITITEQKDIDEFFNLFIDRLEPFLKDVNKPDLIREIFGGSFANEIICADCPHRSEKVEGFLSLNLQIKGKTKLGDSLNSFVAGELLEGSNAYYCGRCEKKVKAKRRTTLKVLPNTLVVVLKRFEYDFTNGYEVRR